MAEHVRKQLRVAVAAAVTNLATTGTRVSSSRVNPIATTGKPCLNVFTPEDFAESSTIHSPPIVDRNVQVRVDGYVTAVADVDNTLDQIAKEVEAALAAGVIIGSKSVQLTYVGCTTRIEPGDKPSGVIEMEFSARLFNSADTPDVLS